MSLGTPPATSLRPTAVLELGRRTQKCKNPTEINPAGFLVLATSYSRTAYRRTTIGAAAFHCRVRNGNGWCHRAIVTRVRNRTWRFRCFRSDASAKPSLWGRGRLRAPLPEFSKEQSTISYQLLADPLIP